MPVFYMQFDGGSRGNPGPAGVGVTLADENDQFVYELGEFLGKCTNNVAEYTGLIRGVEAAIAFGADHLVIQADSELVVKQIKGLYRVKSPDLRPLYEKAIGLMKQIKKVDIGHVYRNMNSRADALANMAMDQRKKIEPMGPLPAPKNPDAGKQSELF